VVGKVINKEKNVIGKIILGALIICVFNFIANEFYFRIDLTKEKRFTLSTSSKNLLKKLDDDLYITVFLDGDLPIEYKQLQSATRDILNEYRLASDGRIKFDFEDILTGKDIKEKESILKEVFQKGLQIEQPELRPDEAPTEKYILPSGIVFYKGKEYPINLLKRQFGKSLEVEINSSIELLEYEIGTAIRKGLSGKSIKLAFSAGHGELSSLQTADIANSLSEFYSLDRINLNLRDSNCYKIFASDVANNPQKPVFSVLVEGLINKLKSYKGLIVAKPVIEFTEPEKYILDQYVMNGGKVIFLVENLLAEMDSVAKYGQTMTVNHGHNLDDILFQYGVKIKPNLVQDIQCHGIPAINQQTNRPGFLPWIFYPLFSAVDYNPVSRNLENVWGRYCSTIDTTARKTLKKTVLLRSSAQSRVAANPVLISLDILKNKQDPSNFRNGNQISAVLVEGEFISPFRYRDGVKRSFDLPFSESIAQNSIIVIGDGDLIRNQVSSDGKVYPLGYDKFASKQFSAPVEFANKKFFLNCVDYLCDDNNLIEVRSKEVILRLLDKGKIKKDKLFWQSLNMILPILMIMIFGFLNAFYRRKRWA